MKLFTIATAVLLRCIRSGEAAAPRLRTNNYAEEVLAESKKKERTAEVPTSSRERISQYVKEGQMFYIINKQSMLYEDPSKDLLALDQIWWFCPATTAPDLNGDGLFDSVVSHVNLFVPPSILKEQEKSGATGADKGSFMTAGYTASWVEAGVYYNEHVVDFGDTTVWQINGKQYIAYETSPPGTTGGLVSCKSYYFTC